MSKNQDANTGCSVPLVVGLFGAFMVGLRFYDITHKFWDAVLAGFVWPVFLFAMIADYMVGIIK